MRACLLATLLSLAPTVAFASPITWEFTGYNHVTYNPYAGNPNISPSVQAGDFAAVITFDPDIAGYPYSPNSSNCPNAMRFGLTVDSFTWGGVRFSTSTQWGGIFTNEQNADIYCGTGTEFAFVAHDRIDFWVGLMFFDPSTLGNESAPYDPTLVTPGYVEFSWGGLNRPYAQAIGTFNQPTEVVMFQTQTRFSAPEVADIAAPEPMSGLLLGTGLALLYLMQLMRRYR